MIMLTHITASDNAHVHQKSVLKFQQITKTQYTGDYCGVLRHRILYLNPK